MEFSVVQVVYEYLEIAEGYGIILTIENNHRNLVRISQLVKRVNSPLLELLKYHVSKNRKIFWFLLQF